MKHTNRSAIDPSGGNHDRARPRSAPRGRALPAVTFALAAAFVVATLVVAARLPGLAWRIEQPLDFNHRLHTDDVGLDCLDCHRQALTGTRATIPNIEVCGDCHDVAAGESANELRLVDHVASGEKIPWRKVYRVPDHVYFSHRRHTQLAGLDCEVCHGAVGEREAPVTRPHRRLDMADCIRCHEESKVSNDCIYCHY